MTDYGIDRFDQKKHAQAIGSSYYGLCKVNDIIEMVRPLLASGGYKLRDCDGRLVYKKPEQAWDAPWHHIKPTYERDCITWNRITFHVISIKLKQPFVPRECQKCFKVVVRPKTLQQLFALLALQKRLERPSKCGIEPRPTVNGLYGGYFYNWGLKNGLDCYKLVREEVDKIKVLGPDTPVLLKRACTEMEEQCGASDKWIIHPQQVHIESLVEQYILAHKNDYHAHEHLIKHTHEKWIRWAYMHGDDTYLLYTNGEPLETPYVTYHHLVDAPIKVLEKVADDISSGRGLDERKGKVQNKSKSGRASSKKKHTKGS